MIGLAVGLVLLCIALLLLRWAVAEYWNNGEN